MQTYFSITIPLDIGKGHRKGVNCLYMPDYTSTATATATGTERGTEEYNIYSGGRDGVVAMHKVHNLQHNEVKCETRAHIQSHTNWVNAICGVAKDQLLISASSDSSLQVHKPCEGSFINPIEVLSDVEGHSDYIKCLSSCDYGNYFVSGGLDKHIFLWDVERVQSLMKFHSEPDQMPPVDFRHSVHFKENLHAASVYTVDCAPDSSLVVSGGPDKLIKAFEPRSGKCQFTIRGHSDTVRSLCISNSSDHLLSCSSDGTVKLWSLGMRRCIQTFADSVSFDPLWTLKCHQRNFSSFYVAGKSGAIFRYFDTGNGYEASLLARGKHPIYDLAVDHSGNVWSASHESNIKLWKCPQQVLARSVFRTHSSRDTGEGGDDEILSGLKNVQLDGLEERNIEDLDPINWKPMTEIPGGLSVVKFALLENKHWVLVEDSTGNISLWDILTAVKIEDFGRKSFDRLKIKYEKQLELCPSWCTVDNFLGVLNVTIEAPKCFDGEIYPDELGIDCFPDDPRLNLAKLICDACFGSWGNRIIDTWKSQIEHIEDVPDEEPILNAARLVAEANTQNEQGEKSLNLTHRSLNSPAARTPSRRNSENIMPVAQQSTIAYVKPQFQINPDSIITIFQRVEKHVVDPALFRFFVKDVDAIDPNATAWCPDWVFECVLKNNITTRDVVKVSFQLFPAPESDLPALPEGQNKLLSNRMIRLRKIIQYVATKTNISNNSNNVIETNVEVVPEQWLELSFQDVSLSPTMYLGTAKQRHAPSTELILFYRPRIWSLDETNGK